MNPQQRLYFLPLLHGQGEFRPILGIYVNLQTRQHGKTVSSSIVMLAIAASFSMCAVPPARKRAHNSHTRVAGIEIYLGCGRVLLIAKSQCRFRPLRSDVSRAERLRSLTENREVAVINEEAASLSTSNFFQYSEPFQMFHRV